MVADVPARAAILAGPGIGHGYTVTSSLMMPSTRGRLRLANASPTTAPVIDYRYYSERRDLATMAAGLRAARGIGASDALKAWHGVEVWPGPAVTDDELDRCPPPSILPAPISANTNATVYAIAERAADMLG
jgi:choline dehydrogenase-like flavoprotein